MYKRQIAISALVAMSFTTDINPTKTKTEFINPNPADQEPSFPGGTEALFAFMGENVKYPKSLEADNTEGKVFVEFVVKADGSISDAKVVKSSGHDSMDDEAVRVVNSMPNWEPGVKDGKPVDVKMVLPFVFKL